MSVIMMMRAKGDPVALESFASGNGEQLERIAQDAKAKGCTHHVFAAGNGEVLVIDEWPNEAAFRDFFDNQPEVTDFMKKAGVKGKPDVAFYRKLETHDEF